MEEAPPDGKEETVTGLTDVNDGLDEEEPEMRNLRKHYKKKHYKKKHYKKKHYKKKHYKVSA